VVVKIPADSAHGGQTPNATDVIVKGCNRSDFFFTETSPLVRAVRIPYDFKRCIERRKSGTVRATLRNSPSTIIGV
jgi:hypothetical protein